LVAALVSNRRVINGLESKSIPEVNALLAPPGVSTSPPEIASDVEELLQRCINVGQARDVLSELLGVAQISVPLTESDVVESDSKQETTQDHQSGALTLEEALGQLDRLVGLAAVKSEITGIVNLHRLNRERQATDRKAIPTGLHMVFAGNPGTGKTTVARMVADIYRSMGILRKGHLVEVDRSDLVAEYVGQTAPRVEKAVARARGGVLFIDEAYSWAGGGGRDFGDEAVSTLVKLMEDHRDDLVVIVAGYSDAMERFIQMNDGLRSRFQHFVGFSDYDDGELLEITALAGDYDLQVSREVAVAIRERFALAPHELRSGNARFARNLFEQMYRRMATRVLTDDVVTEDEHRGFEIEDVPPMEHVPQKRAPGYV
jgi:SpoVK/Ycf46/Vps4 family AAA+-type ATPase